MIPDFTKLQLETLVIAANRPLVICDVDEVIVHFTRAFEDFLRDRSMWLDTASFALNGNVREVGSNLPVADLVVSDLIETFFHDRTANLEPIDDAVSSLKALSDLATVVLLTNLPHHARDKRISNMKSLGISHPVITNSGPKGPAVAHLAKLTHEAAVFIDDSPGFIMSARHHAPDVHLIHFLHDARFAQHLEPLPYVSLTTGMWTEALPHIERLLD
jgi:FMN phosphatase YigB (HAD superfamily)